MELTTAQKLGLVPLTAEQRLYKLQDRLDETSNGMLPRWAYLESEFQEHRAQIIALVTEIRNLEKECKMACKTKKKPNPKKK